MYIEGLATIRKALDEMEDKTVCTDSIAELLLKKIPYRRLEIGC